MRHFIVKLFPVYRPEWPQTLMLLGVATLIGMSFSVSRAATEGLFLTRFGVGALPYVLLVNPMLILAASVVYGAYADRIANARMLIYTALLPLPLIIGLRVLVSLGVPWVYFLLYTLALAYGSMLFISWTVYLIGHYDAQEAKRLVPFITSGQLLGAVLGGGSAAVCAPLIGAANVLWIWLGTLVGVAAVVWNGSRRVTVAETAAKTQRSAKAPGIRQNFMEGMQFMRTSSLVLTTTMVTVAAMLAVQFLDYEYSKIFAQAYPEPATLTAFLGLLDGLTTLGALVLQWFVAPWCLRRLRVQGTNLLFPYLLTAAFGGLLVAPSVATAMAARCIRMGCMPSLRSTALTLILNAVPRRMGARVRNFNTGVAVPVGLWLGALLLILLKEVSMSLLFPALGVLVSLGFVYFSYRQNRAYDKALVGLLRENTIHLLDLHDDDIRPLDGTAVAAISERLEREQISLLQQHAVPAGGREQGRQDMPSAHEKASLAAIALLRTIGSPDACAVLQQHLPLATPRLTAAALQALAVIGDRTARNLLRLYLHDPQPQVRLAALTGLSRLGDPTVYDQAVLCLEDADAQVRAAALAVVLTDPASPATVRAQQVWHAMLASSDQTTQMAALSVLPAVPDASVLESVYQALGHTDRAVRLEALGVLQQLAVVGRLTRVDAALLSALTDEEMEVRECAVQVLAAIGTSEALASLLVVLDDEQPRVRDTLVRAVKPFGRQAIVPLLARLDAPQTSLLAKETVLWALAGLEGVPAEALVPFWDSTLRDVYQYKLMLTCLSTHASLPADAFLRVALQNEHDQILRLLLHLLAVWVSPEVAHLVENGLRDPDRYQRANALEALESLGERRFTRLLLPLLEATEERTATWQAVARHRWHLTFPAVHTVIETCLQATQRWVVIGALLAGHARATPLSHDWRKHLEHVAASATDPQVQQTARQLLGHKVDQLHQTLSLADVMLFLKRVPLYSSLGLEQIYTIASHLAERDVCPGETIVYEGEHSDEFYLIVTGKVDVVKAHGETTATLATLAVGDFFGEMAIFEQLPRVASVVATEESVLLVLSAAHFRRIILQDPAISFGIFRELSARLRRF